MKWHIPKSILVPAVNETLLRFSGHCVDKWGEEEASFCRKLCGTDFLHIETDWIRAASITLTKSGVLNSVNGGPKRKKLTPAQGRYAEYLQSDHWRDFAKTVMSFWDYKCCLCYKRAVDVHHRTYVRIGQEKTTDCVALCRKCHKRTHSIMPDGNNEIGEKENELF